ncbi:MAG TPA: MFS transporter, partial [Thermodesulfobacteriota bacterium]|nr:MFS transporter [Thermodesulfobacteriota bacterium]
MSKALEETRLRGLHWRVWFLSAMGVFLDGFDLFIIGVALPLIQREFSPDTLITGLIGAAAVLGSIAGGSLGGWFTDCYGRKALYLVDLTFFIIFGLLSAISWSVWSLILFRFLLGVGVGVDYPICASYVSEFMPSRIRGKMLIGAFSFQAAGMMFGALAGVIVLAVIPESEAWRWMLGLGVIPAVIVLALRTTVPESPRWLIEKGHFEK